MNCFTLSIYCGRPGPFSYPPIGLASWGLSCNGVPVVLARSPLHAPFWPVDYFELRALAIAKEDFVVSLWPGRPRAFTAPLMRLWPFQRPAAAPSADAPTPPPDSTAGGSIDVLI